MSDPWAEFTKQPAPAASADPWADFLPKAKAEKPSVVEDVAKSAGSGLVRGALGLVGLPGTVAQGLRWGADALADQTVGRAVNYAKTGSWDAPSPPSSVETARQNTVVNLPTPDQVISGENLVDYAAKAAPGVKYQPQTMAGEYARTVGEFAPGALVPGSAIAKVVGGVLAPAFISETAGQIAKGTGLEAPARVVGALAGGIGAAALSKPTSAAAAARGHMSNIDDAQVIAAGRLMEEAASRGMPLTWPEAIAQTSGNATSLTSLQRVVEGSEKGGGVMRGFMSQRPAQIQSAGRAALDDIGAPVTNPTAIAPDMQAAARSALGDTAEGQAYAQRLWEAGPRMSPERAGRIIQPELRSVYERREGMRAALADQDYSAARNAPAEVPLNGGFGFRDVARHYDGPDIPILINPAEREAARAQQQVARNPVENMPVIGIKPTEFGQVDANSVARHLDDAIEGAKGSVRQGLQAAKSALYRPDGALDASVGGLHNSRMAITDLIDQAKRAGANNTVRELEGALGTLDQALEAVPAYGQARRGFEAASRPLSPFGESRAPGQIVAKDQYGRDFVMPPEQAGRAIIEGGPSAARDFNAVATGPAREALEAQLTTQVLDRAIKSGSDISSDAIWQALRQNEDLLAQFPAVRERLTNIAVSREGLAALDKTPLGMIAQRDATTRQAINAIFPKDPIAGQAGEVASTMKALVAKNPAAAERLVRAHAETVFNAATRKLTGGQNEFGAAKFSAALTGNVEQAAALEAAVRALPNGGARWDGFRKFMEVAEATGQRQRIGSQTAFNKEFMDNLSKGGAIGDALPVIKSGGTALPGMIRDRYAQYQLGKNTQELARLITDPNALPVFRALAKEATGGARAQAATLRLLALAQQGRAASER